jgi:hypothetical protein
VGQDANGEDTITINPDGTFEHQITSTGAVRLFKGTYTQQGDSLLLSYSNYAEDASFSATITINGNTATFDAGGYVPDMPEELSLTMS